MAQNSLGDRLNALRAKKKNNGTVAVEEKARSADVALPASAQTEERSLDDRLAALRRGEGTKPQRAIERATRTGETAQTVSPMSDVKDEYYLSTLSPSGKDEKENLRQESRIRSQLAKGSTPEKLGTQAQLRQQKLQNLSADELKKRHTQALGHLEDARKAVEKRNRETHTTSPYSRPWTEEDKDLQGELDKWRGIADDLAGRYYFRENEEKLASLSGDRKGQEKLKAAQTVEDELRMLGRVATGTFEDEQDARDREYLMKKYGLSERDLEVQATDLIQRLQGDLELAKGEAKAAGYDYDRMKGYQDRKEQTQRAITGMQHTAEYASDHPVISSGMSILAGPAQSADYFSQLIGGFGHSDTEKLESYVPANVYEMRATNFVRNVRGTVAQGLEEKYGLEIGGQNVASFLYQTGMSMGDFLFNSMLTGNFSGGLGGTGTQAAQKAASNLSLAIMGSSAAANTTAEAIDRGLSNRQAYTLGAVAGVAEILTEKVSLETLLDKTSLNRSAVGYLLKNVLAEGSEEVASDLINWAADVIVSKDRSQWRRAIREYEDQGYDESEAFGLALKDQAIDMGMSFLGGGLSGGVMAGGAVGWNALTSGSRNGNAYDTTSGEQRSVEEILGDLARSMEEDGESDPLTKKLAEGGRFDYQELTPEMMETWNRTGREDVGIDADGKVYQITPEDHIDQRTPESVGARNVMSFQFNHPSLSRYFKQAARELASDLSSAVKGERWSREVFNSESGAYETQVSGQKRDVTDTIAWLLDDQSLSYGDIRKAIDAILSDHGQENYAAAKRVELALDDMLTYGYTAADGQFIPPDEEYISAKGQIPGGATAEETDSALDGEIPAWDIENPAPAMESQKLAEQQEENAAIVREASKALGRQGSVLANELYQPDAGQTPADYFSGFSDYYRAGLTGQSMESVTGEFASRLSDPQRQAAYMAGQIDSEASMAEEKAKTEFASLAGEDAGLVYDDFVKRAVKSGRKINGKTYLTKDTYKRMNALAKALGVRVTFADSVFGGKANASINIQKDGKGGNEVLIEKDNPHPIRSLLGHEFTHRIQQLAPEEYRAFRDYVGQLDTASNDVAAMMDLSKKNGVEIGYEEAMDEVAAEYAGELFEKSETLDRFIRENMENRSLLERVRDFFRDVLDKLTGKERSRANEAEQKLTEALQAAKEMTGALTDSKNAATDGGEARRSINSGFSGEVRIWYKNGQKPGEEFTLGSTGPVLQGLGAIESDIFMEGDKISSILKDHPEMTIREIERIPELLEDPVLVLESKGKDRNGHNSRLLIFGSVKAQDGRPVMCVLDLRPTDGGFLLDDMQKVSSAYTKSSNPEGFISSSDVLYADKKRTIRALRSAGFTDPVSLTLTRSGSIGSITYRGKNVNISGVPFSDVVNTEDTGKFSMKDPVEESGDLVALHNLTEDKLLKSLALGGFPMPSIAVTKAGIPHTNFGDITLVMDKSTIDPEADRRNMVYSADAWTPTFPATEYEADEKVSDRLHKKYYELFRKFGRDNIDVLYPWGNYPEDQLNREGGEAAVLEKFKDNTDMMKVYLLDKGMDVPAPVTIETVNRLDDGTIALYDHMISELGEDVVKSTKRPDGFFASPAFKKEWYAEHGEAVEAAYRSFLKKNGFTDEQVENAMDHRNTGDNFSLVVDARRYLANGPETRRTSTDTQATEKAIRDSVDQADYQAWLQDLFGGIEKSSGIYNGKERYTPSGDRRSFKALHLPVTLENITKAMVAEGDGDNRNVTGFYGVKSLRASTASRFSSIKNMHELEGRLQNLTEEEAGQINDALHNRLFSLLEKVYNTKPHSQYDNQLIDMDTIGNILMDAARSKKITVDGIIKEFSQSGYKISSPLAVELRDLLFDISQMPVNIFEAKPERSVGFNEVLAAIIPDTSSNELRSKLEEVGVPIVEYAAGDDTARMEKANSVEGARFSLKETDSQGRKLTDEQQEFFKDSKVVDKDNRLLGVYHSTWSDPFTVFDRGRLGENTDGNATDQSLAATAHIGFWFNTQDLSGKLGNRSESVYLDIKQPYRVDSLDGLAADVEDKGGAEVFVEWMNEEGYDGLEVTDEEFGGTSFVALDPNQIKRVDNKTPTKDPDIRYSLKGEEELLRETRALVRRARKEGWSDAQLRQARLEAVDRVYQSLIEEYGSIDAGETPAREIQVPKRTSKDRKVSQTVRTILEAKATPETAIPTIQEMVAKGEFSFETITDKAAIERAESAITDKNWGKSLADWKKDMAAGKVTKDNTALGWALYNNAANSGNLDVAMDILQEMVKSQRSAAQALQATRILKKLSPEGQLYGAVKSVEGLQKELNDRYGEKNAPELTISEELGRKLLEAKNQAERDAALRDIYRDIGRQMPSRFRDKWNAWRYLSMLGNPRTHVRNVVGNAGFAPVVAVKDLTATGIEKIVSAVSGGALERSKGLVGFGKTGRALLSAAWADYANVEEAALGGGKYSDFQNANKYIEEGRVIFRSKVGKALEAARKANSYALDREDVWFSRPHYAYALAQFCKAHKITEAEIRNGNDQVLAAARNYAIREAQKATYRDTNALSQTVSRLGRDMTQGKNPVSKGLGVLAEGILPFRKTPANILARGLEYSPMGLVKGLSYDLSQVQKGRMTGAEAIDNISAGLTGTGLLALGVYLAAQGLVRGKGAGDDKERELEKLQGHQDYALELPDGTSVTLDWLAPEALPFFVGVNLWETAQGGNGNVTLSQMMEAIGNVSEPMLEMSCLQSLNDVLEAGSKVSSQGLGALPSALASAATSYLTQGLPTLFGQLERTGEDERETTYTERNAFLTPDMQYTLGKVSGKIPVWEYQQIPYIDAWGRHESSGKVGERAFNNLLNPAYTSQIEESDMEKELLRLYQETGDTGVFPKRASKYFNVDGERKDLTAEEYVRYAETKGQTSLRLVTDLTESKLYSGMEDGVKAEAVEDAYTYANQTARSSIDSGATVDSWVAKAQEAEKKYKIPVSTYILLRNMTQDVESLKDADGDTISNSKGLRIMQEIYGIKGLNDNQRGYLFETFGVGKTVRHYNKAAVEEALNRMEKQGK